MVGRVWSHLSSAEQKHPHQLPLKLKVYHLSLAGTPVLDVAHHFLVIRYPTDSRLFDALGSPQRLSASGSHSIRVDALHPRRMAPSVFLGLGGVFGLFGMDSGVAYAPIAAEVHRPASSGLALYGTDNKVRGVLLASQSGSTGGSCWGTSREVLTEVSVTSVAAMFGYSRRYQRAHFLRLSFIKHLRRYLLALGQLGGSLAVVGAIRQFRSYFRVLNLPTNQVF